MKAPPMTFRPRQLVRRVATPSDAPVRVWRVTRFGVWVTLPDGRRVCWHPDDVEPAPYGEWVYVADGEIVMRRKPDDGEVVR